MFRSTVLCLTCWTGLVAAQAPAPQRSHSITIDDYFTQADIFQVAFSPDLRHVAYTEGRWQQATDDRKADLWVVDLNRRVRRLTSDRAGDRNVQWARDSRTLLFLGNRKREAEKRPPYDGKAQVWKTTLDGGEPTALTRVEGGVEAFDLAHDDRHLYYLVHEEAVGDDWKELRLKYKTLEYGHGLNRRSIIWKLNLETQRAEKVVDSKRFIHEFTVASTGKIAMITAPDDKVVTMEGHSTVDVYDPETGKITVVPTKAYRQDTPSPHAWLEKVAWAPDGNTLAFNAIFDAYPARIMLARWRPGGAEPAVFPLRLPGGLHVKGYGTPLAWRGPRLYFLGEVKGRVGLYYGGQEGPDDDPVIIKLTPGDLVVETFSLPRNDNDDDRFGAAIASPNHFADVFVNTPEQPSNLYRLTNVNPQAESWKLPQLSVVQWKGAGGDPVEGILELPHDYKKGQKVPLVVEIHGGPTTASYFKLQYWIYGRTLLPANGYAVLCPNYRGSTGYGDKFLTDLVGRENNIEVEDILKGVDHLVAEGIADPDKLAVTGWSNGGYLTNCIITKTTRFKAAISGAGIVDAIMEWGSNDEPAYAMVFKQGFPWSVPDKYHKASPTYQLDKIRTPTLIHVGANDERCPPGHSRMLYRALKEYVKVPTELIVYPGEGHGLMKYRNRRAKLEWDLAWLDRYVMGKKK